MMWVKGVILGIYFLLFICLNTSFAKNIQYTTPPFCNSNKVICKNSNEVPVCLVLNPKVHIESLLDYNNKKILRYHPSCNGDPENLLPVCLDKTDNKKASKEVVIECIEYARCSIDKDTNSLSAICSSGKVAKCLGTNSEPNCNDENICRNDSIPVCDYVWHAYVPFQRG